MDWFPLEAKSCSVNLFHRCIVIVLLVFGGDHKLPLHITFLYSKFIILYHILMLKIILFWTLLELKIQLFFLDLLVKRHRLISSNV
jgi:hypothetical protein